MILSHISTPVSLYHRWNRWRIQQKSALLALPVEVLLIVDGFLSNVETATFRMTCRLLYYHEPRLQSMLVGASRAALLKLLEQDNPKIYYCHSCEVLHPLYKIASIRPVDNIWHSFGRYGCHSKRLKRLWRKDDSPCCLCDQEEVFVSSKYVLHFDLARLAIDRHLYGPFRGISLDLLARRVQPSSFGCFYSSATEIWEARIIDGHLFLSSIRCTHGTEHHDIIDDDNFTLGFDRHHYAICQHLSFGFGMKIGAMRISSLEQYLQYTEGEFKGSCEYCLTDYQLDKDLVAKVVRLTTFHCLGTCRSPEDWMWRSFSPRMKYGSVEPMGTVTAPHARKSWLSGALVYEPFAIKEKVAWKCAVAG